VRPKVTFHCHERWLSLFHEADKIISFDVTSFRSSSTEIGEKTLYDTVTLPQTDKETLVETLSSLITPCYDHVERDGYPMKCIKCKGNTIQASCYESDSGCYSSMSFGKSFCVTCKIRYSKSSKHWQCAKPSREDHMHCGNKMEEENSYCCDKEHLSECDYELEYKTTPEDTILYNKQAEVTMRVKIMRDTNSY
jgi:hypothetical protein